MKSNWYAVYSKPREELRAQEHLSNQGMSVVLPQIRAKKRVAGKLSAVVQPMFPRYLFVALCAGEDDFSKIRSTRGCVDLVKFGGKATPVPDDFMVALNGWQAGFPDGIVDLTLSKETLKVGQEVAVTEGPFQGLLGKVCALKANDRVILLLDLLGGQRKVEVALGDLNND